MDRKKVLIVDDDPDLRRGLAVRLRAHNYATSFAEDAITALSVARREHPDLIVLDLGLPGGDGLVTLERLGNISDLAGIPVIVVTGRDAAEEAALAGGATAFFQKPADNEALLAAIREALGEP